MTGKLVLPNLPLLLRRRIAPTSARKFFTLPATTDRFFPDSDDDLGLGLGPGEQNPPWLDAACSGVSDDDAVVSKVWKDGKVGGRKRGEEIEIGKLFLSSDIVTRLAARGITKMFPIQRAVFDPALQGRDMICRAKTGTGKTLAYGIPIMDKIVRFKANPRAKRRVGRNPLALIMTPTRELAQQVKKELRDSSPLRILSLCGGEPFARQLNELNYGVDILVGTPGRINDLLNKNVLNLSNVQYLVLDESDEMLAVSFAQTVEKILGRLPRRHQSIMFSSTMPSWMSAFKDCYLNDPLIIDLVGDSMQKLPEGLVFYSIASSNYHKHLVINPLIKEYAMGGKCIVFTRSKFDVDQLSNFLGRNCKCEALHADMPQNQRDKTLADFCEGNFNILIATDVASRGLHIPDVDMVIHFDVPSISENFLHRSGRTGRAGKKGIVILIHTEDQMDEVRIIEQDIGCTFIELPRMITQDEDQPLLGSDGVVKPSRALLSDHLNRTRYSRFGQSDGNFQCKGQQQRSNLTLETNSKTQRHSGFHIPMYDSSENYLGEYVNTLFGKLASMQSTSAADHEGSTSKPLCADSQQRCVSECSEYTNKK